jgi:hypothetical protein
VGSHGIIWICDKELISIKDEAQKPDDVECNTESSEPFRIRLNYSELELK